MSQFLTKLDRPKLWDGYPFLISVLVPDIDANILLVVEGYNVAGVLQATHESAEVDGDNSVVSFNVTDIYGSLTDISYLLIHVETETGEELTDDLRIDVESPCENPVFLLGRDSLGGHLQWMFDTNQELSNDYDNDRKAKRKLLTAVNLTANTWDSLEDFIGLGQVYKNNIVEFDSSTIKTSTRIGQQVYDVDTDGSKVGVIVIPIRNKTRTKQIKHVFEMEIEYPEVFAS